MDSDRWSRHRAEPTARVRSFPVFPFPPLCFESISDFGFRASDSSSQLATINSQLPLSCFGFPSDFGLRISDFPRVSVLPGRRRTPPAFQPLDSRGWITPARLLRLASGAERPKARVRRSALCFRSIGARFQFIAVGRRFIPLCLRVVHVRRWVAFLCEWFIFLCLRGIFPRKWCAHVGRWFIHVGR
jgi:hypothetical protein